MVTCFWEAVMSALSDRLCLNSYRYSYAALSSKALQLHVHNLCGTWHLFWIIMLPFSILYFRHLSNPTWAGSLYKGQTHIQPLRHTSSYDLTAGSLLCRHPRQQPQWRPWKGWLVSKLNRHRSQWCFRCSWFGVWVRYLVCSYCCLLAFTLCYCSQSGLAAEYSWSCLSLVLVVSSVQLFDYNRSCHCHCTNQMNEN